MFKTILVHLPPRRILLYPMAPSCLFSISLLRPQCFDCVRSVLIPRQSRNFTSVSSNDLNGLFQLPNLYKAQDFQQLTQDAIVKCEEIKRKVGKYLFLIEKNRMIDSFFLLFFLPLCMCMCVCGVFIQIDLSFFSRTTNACLFR
jgi:hypothetical protein